VCDWVCGWGGYGCVSVPACPMLQQVAAKTTLKPGCLYACTTMPPSQSTHLVGVCSALPFLQSVMGERRPNCVIIDEIDGATGGWVCGWVGE
jgi:hypothetical protein